MSPLYLNDFLFHYFEHNYIGFITTFYLSDLIVILLAAYSINSKIFSLSQYRLTILPFRQLILTSIALSLFGILYFHYFEISLSTELNTSALWHFPQYPSPTFKLIDLTLGLTLTAVAEELIFRGILIDYFSQKYSQIVSVCMSLILFGLIHWGSGSSAVLNAVIWAIPSTIFVLKYRSIYPTIIGHFLTNLMLFSSLIAK